MESCWLDCGKVLGKGEREGGRSQETDGENGRELDLSSLRQLQLREDDEGESEESEISDDAESIDTDRGAGDVHTAFPGIGRVLAVPVFGSWDALENCDQ